MNELLIKELKGRIKTNEEFLVSDPLFETTIHYIKGKIYAYKKVLEILGVD